MERLLLSVLTLAVSSYVAYKTKRGSMESEMDRQRILKDSIGDQKAVGDPTVVRIESIDFHSHSRNLRNLLQETCPGHTILTIGFMNAHIDPEFLDNLTGESQEIGGVEAAIGEIHQSKHTTMVEWSVNTNEASEIMGFTNALADIADEGLEKDADWISNTGSVKWV